VNHREHEPQQTRSYHQYGELLVYFLLLKEIHQVSVFSKE